MAQWRIPGGGKGRIIAIGPHPTDAELRALGKRLSEEFRHLDTAVVMVFNDAAAARSVRQGSRIVGEERFRRAITHQRAMYIKSWARGEHSFTIYDAHPKPREIINYK